MYIHAAARGFKSIYQNMHNCFNWVDVLLGPNENPP